MIWEIETFNYDPRTKRCECKLSNGRYITIFKYGKVFPKYVYFEGRIKSICTFMGQYLIFTEDGFWPERPPKQETKQVKKIYKELVAKHNKIC